MDPETEKIIKKQLEILPEEVKKVFVDPKIDEQISEVGKNFNFDDEKIGILQMETTLLMLGLTNPDEYPNELKSRLGIENQTINNIVEKIKIVISPKIIEKLKEIYKKTENEQLEEKNKFSEKTKGEMALLPKEKQEVINSLNWEKTIEEIGKNHNLLEDEIEVLKEEVKLILVNNEYRYFISLNLQENTNIKKDEAEKIAKEVEEKIFTPMMNKLNENIKKTLKIRNIHWQQNLNFILSGGDYTAFIERVENEKKDELPNPNESFNPSKLDDLKSKFTI